ncbi:patatin [Candidatus Poribacteria bacterium]|nr:patatin [Candidatus Poribacteria bacterium]MYK22085.1 patatin [Candidatus Poribacteria bacterium]
MGTESKTFNVLSIDGGGIRGIIPAMILAEIEEMTGKPIWKLFDLIAGTSTGGIIALALTKPRRRRGKWERHYEAEDIVQFYKREGKSIFNRSTRHTILSVDGWIDKKYPERGMQRVLRRYFGDFRLSETLTDVLIPSYDMRGTRQYWDDEIGERSGGHPRFFKSSRTKCCSQPNIDCQSNASEGSSEPNTDCNSCEDCDSCKSDAKRESSNTKCRYQPHEDYLMREVAYATAAAPTYFPPLETQFTPPIDSGARIENLVETLVDGGIFANNPAMCAYAEATKRRKETERTDENILLVSLGTGNLTKQLNADAAKHWGKTCWIEPLFTMIFDGANDTVNYQLKQLIDQKDYYRFQEDLWDEGSDEMDNPKKRHLRDLKKFAECLIEKRECELKRLSERLEANRSCNCKNCKCLS